MKLRPLSDGIIINTGKKEKTTEYGFVLVDEMSGLDLHEKSETATVVSTGEKVTEVSVGDKIIFKKWAVQEFEIDDEKYLSIKEEDIIATYEL